MLYNLLSAKKLNTWKIDHQIGVNTCTVYKHLEHNNTYILLYSIMILIGTLTHEWEVFYSVCTVALDRKKEIQLYSGVFRIHCHSKLLEHAHFL